jgi:Na+-driven multidrug efflux pump
VALVFPFGIAGVAAATLLAQACSAAYCAYTLRGVPQARITLADVRGAETLELLRVGLPLGLRNAVIEIGGLGIQRYINGFGTVFVAGVAAAKRMYSLLLVAGGAMEASVGVFVAQNHGAGLSERVRKGMGTGLRLMLGAAAVMAALTLLFGRSLLWLLVAGEPGELAAVLDAGTAQLNVMALGLPFLHLLFLYRSALQGVGRTWIPALTGFLELIGRFAALWVLAPLWGLWGAYLADPLGWVLGAGLSVAGWMGFRRQITDNR